LSFIKVGQEKSWNILTTHGEGAEMLEADKGDRPATEKIKGMAKAFAG
jgi:hypothetical protein